MKEGKFIASRAVTSHNLANKIHLHLQGLLSKIFPRLRLASYQSPHFISSVSLGSPETHRTMWPWVLTTRPTGWSTTFSATKPPAEGWAMIGSGQQTRMASQSLTAGSTQQQPLMALHTAKWGSTCQQLRNNGTVLAHLAERSPLWVTWLPIS